MIRVIRGECEGGGMDHLVNLKFMKLDLHVVCHIKNHTVNRGGVLGLDHLVKFKFMKLDLHNKLFPKISIGPLNKCNYSPPAGKIFSNRAWVGILMFQMIYICM